MTTTDHPHILVVTGRRRPDGMTPDEWTRWLALESEIERELSAAMRQAVHVITGDATGVDTLAASVAESHRVPFDALRARWGKYGRNAGPLRNAEMIDAAIGLGRKHGVPVVCYAFPGSPSKGTRDCINKAIDAGIHVVVWQTLHGFDVRNKGQGALV